jgi:hypothetical protein
VPQLLPDLPLAPGDHPGEAVVRVEFLLARGHHGRLGFRLVARLDVGLGRLIGNGSVPFPIIFLNRGLGLGNDLAHGRLRDAQPLHT